MLGAGQVGSQAAGPDLSGGGPEGGAEGVGTGASPPGVLHGAGAWAASEFGGLSRQGEQVRMIQLMQVLGLEYDDGVFSS